MTQIEITLAHSKPGFELCSAASGYWYEKQDEGDWIQTGTGKVFTNAELAEEEGDNLE